MISVGYRRYVTGLSQSHEWNNNHCYEEEIQFHSKRMEDRQEPHFIRFFFYTKFYRMECTSKCQIIDASGNACLRNVSDFAQS